MVQPLGFIEFPPGNAWELYILFLLIPGILRLMLLAKPFLSVTKQLAPHGGWFLKRLKELPVKGYTLLALNEILSFSLPILVVLLFRFWTDPLGWSSWDETNWIGNGNIIPSGPLRESLGALKYADCIMIKGKKDQKKERQLLNYNKKLQFFYFDYNIEIDNSIREKKFITFAGIGNPESFFELLTRKNLNVIKKISFPDHHKFTNNDLDKIINFANENNAIILTTEKDYERLDHKYKSLIYFTKLGVKIEKFDAFKNLIKEKI